MEYPIRCLSDYAFALLRRRGEGAVHSVYRKTINISFSGNLLALQASPSPLSPISLLLEADEAAVAALGFTPGQPVRVSAEGLASAGTSFPLRGADIIPLGLAPLASGTEQLKTSIRQAVLAADTGGFDLLFHSGVEGLSPTLACAAKRLSQCAGALHAGDEAAAISALCGLIGLGTGLTPSGDDFLCGVLAGLILKGQGERPFAQKLRRRISGLLGNTNDISAAFLSCALKGRFSEPVERLRETPGPRTLLPAFLDIGHSSGVDTLCGILFALESL